MILLLLGSNVNELIKSYGPQPTHTCVALILLCTVMLSMSRYVSTTYQDIVNVSLSLSNSLSTELDDKI